MAWIGIDLMLCYTFVPFLYYPLQLPKAISNAWRGLEQQPLGSEEIAPCSEVDGSTELLPSIDGFVTKFLLDSQYLV